MPEPEIKQGQTSEPETVKTEPAKETISADERAELEALRKQSELSKNEISTRDRKLTEIQKELKSKMTDEERIKAEAEAERKEWLSDMSKIQAETLGLDEKHAALIRGTNKQEIKESADLIKSLIDSISSDKDKQIKKLEDELKTYKAIGTPPPSGSPMVTATLQTQFNEAKKLNDLPMQMAIKRQAQREGFVINE